MKCARIFALCLAAASAVIAAPAVRVELPFVTLKGHGLLLVHASVAGKDGVFIFDSGADVTMVDAAFAGFSEEQLRSAMPRKSLQAGVWSGAVATGSLCLAQHCFVGRDIGVVPRGRIAGESKEARIDGILGQDVLREFDCVAIDYKRGVIVLTKNGGE